MLSPLQIVRCLDLPALRPIVVSLGKAVNHLFQTVPVLEGTIDEVSDLDDFRLLNHIGKLIELNSHFSVIRNSISRMRVTIKKVIASPSPDNCPHCGHAIDYLELLKNHLEQKAAAQRAAAQRAAAPAASDSPQVAQAFQPAHVNTSNPQSPQANANNTTDSAASPADTPEIKPLRPYPLRNFPLRGKQLFRNPQSAIRNDSPFRTSPRICPTIPLDKLEAYTLETLAMAQSLCGSASIPEIPNPHSDIDSSAPSAFSAVQDSSHSALDASSPCLRASVVKDSSPIPEIPNPQSEIAPVPDTS